MRDLRCITNRLPEKLRDMIQSVPSYILEDLEEIRLRAGQRAALISSGNEYLLDFICDNSFISRVLSSMLEYSYYAYEEELAKGYVTIEGGHRVGICGRAVLERGNVRMIKDISSLNIRCGKEIRGVSDGIINEIIDGGIKNTLIVSPPKCGKTTLLRDIIRALSYGGRHVGVCDERSEISGCYMGRPSYDMGPRTDIMDGCPKAEGMMMLIRAMSPEVICTDEIGKKEDVYAIEAALCAGISLITTIHADTYDDLLYSNISGIVKDGVFKKLIFLSNSPGTGTVREIINV